MPTLRSVFAAGFVLSLLACQPQASVITPTPAASSSALPVGSLAELQRGFINHYAQNVSLTYQDALTQTKALQNAVDTLVATPSEAHLTAAREAWLKARKPYGQTEGFRFSDGPIDDEDGPEGLMNAWPMDEVYVDYVAGQPDAGIINRVKQYPEINAQLLRDLNEAGGDKNISTGYHAIEFLLWGQDLSEGPGAGERPFTDYSTAANADRRGTYLKTITQMLVDDLQFLVDAWAPEQTGNYRANFQSMDSKLALAKILKGIGTLSASELSSERIATPLDIGDREEEHSCFSDNTHNDVLYNAMSIHNVIVGSYQPLSGKASSGTGLLDLLKVAKPDLASRLETASNQTLTLAKAIQAPFDQEIRPDNAAGNQRLLSLVQALKSQGALLVEAAQALGITINTDL